jgi:F-type H+-transporting ATPase subunit b
VLPDLSVLWVIGFVLLLAVILDRVLFKPLTRVMQQREQAIGSAMALAQESAARAAAAGAEVDRKIAAARTEVYREMDEKRHVALDRRGAVLARTREEVERTVADGSARLQAQAAEARTRLERDADSLAGAIVERILGQSQGTKP